MAGCGHLGVRDRHGRLAPALAAFLHPVHPDSPDGISHRLFRRRLSSDGQRSVERTPPRSPAARRRVRARPAPMDWLGGSLGLRVVLHCASRVARSAGNPPRSLLLRQPREPSPHDTGWIPTRTAGTAASPYVHSSRLLCSGLLAAPAAP